MATTNSRGKTELPMNKRYQETSPDRTLVWFERKKPNNDQKVPVVYYLSHNGHLEHPHFLEVPLSSPQGLFLKDVINKLNTLRGDGMANRFSWSSKRSYKNGFVWQDLSENDYIYPFSSTSSISKNSSETYSSSEDSNVAGKTRRKYHSWSEFKELDDEQKIYKAKTSRDFSSKGNSVSTQTEHEMGSNQVQEDSRPSSNSNSEILKSMNIAADIRDQSVENDRPSGRIKAAAVLMQLIACGSKRVKDLESMEIRG
ncbi:protein SOSEKI 2 isoform X4 [Gossypium hirsutum]|uniref:Protein SOSEKI 2 isoform X4 n=1 Tax=Gossypium hirsutum TaxID=3635 RepID=A0A1U8IL62_GOSHI|nr:protein SOSEKI 2-like isoform X4 [Gossypium hirsutum]